MRVILWVAVLVSCFSGSVAGTPGSPQQTDRGKLELRRFRFPAEFYKAPSGVFNPAAVWNPTLGWVIVFRWDKCFYQRCGIHHTETTPLVSLCGTNASAPDFEAAITQAGPWSFEEQSLQRVLESNSATTANTADLRLFNFQGSVYAGHWVKFGWSTADVPSQHKCWSDGWGDRHSCEYTAISRLDFDSKKLEMVHQFHVPILGHTYRSEKNWAFLEEGDSLTIFYSMLPCTAIFTFDPKSSKGVVFRKGLCYDQKDTILRATGHVLKSSRLSGNPVRWQPPGQEGEELLAMVHARTSKHSYANWALRLAPDNLAITHISTRPVIQSSDYAKLEGYFAGVLVVGSFHVVQADDGAQMLRMLLGEGDQYSAWEEVPMAGISWHALDAPVECATENDVLQFSRRRQSRRLQHSAQRGGYF